MKITSFSPLIVTTDPENTIKLFEELGFEKRHTKDDLEGRDDVVGVRMKDANGFYVDVVEERRTYAFFTPFVYFFCVSMSQQGHQQGHFRFSMLKNIDFTQCH